MPDPIPADVIERELRYASALGIVDAYALTGTKAVDGMVYRRYVVTTNDDEAHVWTPAQVMAFAVGVRLASERGGT